MRSKIEPHYVENASASGIIDFAADKPAGIDSSQAGTRLARADQWSSIGSKNHRFENLCS
jgi:hypothetical protein